MAAVPPTADRQPQERPGAGDSRGSAGPVETFRSMYVYQVLGSLNVAFGS